MAQYKTFNYFGTVYEIVPGVGRVKVKDPEKTNGRRPRTNPCKWCGAQLHDYDPLSYHNHCQIIKLRCQGNSKIERRG